MTIRVLEHQELLAERRQASFRRDLPIYVTPTGEIASQRVPFVVKDGQAVAYQFGKPLGEMLSTPQDYDGLIQKSIIDINIGRERVPLLYGPIYRTIENAGFTEQILVEDIIAGGMQAVFLEHMEGEEVRMMSRRFGARDSVPIVAYATGVQVTNEMVVYDKRWSFEQALLARGEAYNALLNHLHLYPIFSYVYPAKNQTAAAAGIGSNTVRENTRETIRQAFIHASQDYDPVSNRNRRPSILLAHSSRRFQIEDALQRMLIGGTEYAALSGINTVIYYDGYAVTVAGKTYTYSPVPENKGYLIDPQGYFISLVKHDLLTLQGNPDVSRLIEAQTVWIARRGVFASLENTVEELTWP